MSLSRLQRTLPWITVVTVVIVRPCAAENWPGFRGPTGQGISHEKNLLTVTDFGGHQLMVTR